MDSLGQIICMPAIADEELQGMFLLYCFFPFLIHF